MPRERAATGSVPVPVRLTVCGLPGALSANDKVAARAPVAVGVKVTLTVQVPFWATLAPVQVSALVAKSPGLVPPRLSVLMLSVAVPLLVTVTVWAELAVSRSWVLKATGLGEMVAAGPVPVPLRLTD